jgi:hypothetical protein
MDQFEPPKYLSSLTATINDGSKSVQAGTLAFSVVGLYLVATAFSATDELGRTTPVAQLGVQLPVPSSTPPAAFSMPPRRERSNSPTSR